MGGKFKKNIAITSCNLNKIYQVFDVGVLQPELNSQ
jgi:hypothetical protein